MIRKSILPNSELAPYARLSHSTLYYHPKQPEKDWSLKCQIEEALHVHPSYGHKRLAIELNRNKKAVLRVMKIFGLHPYRRRGKKPFKINRPSDCLYPNLLLTNCPSYENHIWVADFTYIPFQGKFVYLATVMDLFTRKIVGYAVLTNHSSQLVINALLSALLYAPRSVIFHSDNGTEYESKDFTSLLSNVGTLISRSRPGSPWENGYQESFYSQFKVDLGDPARFKTLGELVYEIYRLVWDYNNTRIHSAFKMAPNQFAARQKSDTIKLMETVS
jgi:transposase InsO family protein